MTYTTSHDHQAADAASIKVATNTVVKNKPERDDRAAWTALTRNFKNHNLSVSELIDSIRAGYAFCAQHRNSRKSSNFQCMQVLAVDIDSGMTLESALQSEFFRQFGSFIYTTFSHQPDAHRFRIVFVMETPIVTEERMRAAYNGIIRKFGGDRSCTDACRMFFGAEGCEVHFIGQTLPVKQVEYLIELGETQTDARSKKKGPADETERYTCRSSDALHVDEIVVTERQGSQLLADLPSRTRVFCPRHDDRHASAIVVTSKANQNGVFCSACARTFWPPMYKRDHLLSFDFDDFEGTLLDVAHEEHPFEWLDDDAPAEYRQMTEGAGVFERDSRYLAPKLANSNDGDESPGNQQARGNEIPPLVRNGVTFVRSPKGTGKTEWLDQVITQLKAEGLSVLLIGHRQALLHSLAGRLGLHCYLDRFPENADPALIRRYYAVCLDSLHLKLKPWRDKFDVIIIDESEQVYSHLTASTLGEKRKSCFETLHHYVKVAGRVVLCDADLSWLTVNVTDTLRAGKGPAYAYLNRYRKEAGHNLYLYGDKDQLTERVLAAVEAGGKQYVACNSKDEAKTIAKMLNHKFGSKRRIQLITSDNSSTNEAQAFIRAISVAVADYDVLIVSPALGTGIDISVDVDAHKFTHVFGLFDAGITTHFDMDQQLSRVRKVKEQHVWVSPAIRFIEYEVDAVRNSLLANGELPELLKGYTVNGKPEYDTDNKLLDVFAQVISMRNASLNNLRQHFIRLKQNEGWTIVEVPLPEAKPTELIALKKAARADVKEERINAIVNAKRITGGEFEKLRNKQDASLAEKVQAQRYWISEFYGVKEVTPELVALDDHGRYQECVRLYSRFTATAAQRLGFAMAEKDKPTVNRKGYQRKCDLLRKLLQASCVADGDGLLDTFVQIETRTLQTFVKVVEEEMTDIGLVLGVNVRDDLRTKPMSQLRGFLGLLGLQFGKAHVRYEGKKKIYSYSLDLDSLELMETYCAQHMRHASEVHAVGNIDSESTKWDLMAIDTKRRRR
ncbi:hypothetical protein N5J06_03895 [Ralstonia sp. CHL-2022]|uniref:Replication origin-binding protein domain-containing protein n=1 Tax=Ralstonia mojiangensis TaxID=2953895 RepID=A0ABT2L4D1_9RALS|nr:plasmid replication protein, CyRepA1 family [Ralstonia mojiangensis]MCT7310072.1 hypothetical protein [Ralstonia mojiangensis]